MATRHKTDVCARTVIAGHAAILDVRRGHHEVVVPGAPLAAEQLDQRDVDVRLGLPGGRGRAAEHDA
ncbi:MAG TPA: hypothetical protein VFA63_19920 [Pseudonocardiaceae bacterium]|jgi:hypothetical protein|nr:hypothetical protein [Pseudonocardiaceae bacterium]